MADPGLMTVVLTIAAVLQTISAISFQREEG
jgi:hypothetical protein